MKKDFTITDYIQKHTLNSLAEGILLIDRNYKIVFTNKTMLQLCGQEREDVIGQKCHKFSHQCPVPCYKKDESVICPHFKVFKTGEPMSVTHTQTLPDGTERIFEITASPVKDEKGNVVQMVEVLRDVTEKEKLGRKSMEQESFLSSILNGIGEGVVVVDRDFKIILANKQYLEQAKSTLDEVMGKHCYEVSHRINKPCYEAGEECTVKHVFEKGEHHMAVHTHHDKDGNAFYVETNSYPFKDASGKLVCAIETIKDITTRIKLEQELKNRLKELEEFYDIAVGRELKMMELKNEVEKLKNELKKSKS
ncbi:MAG: PAS domain-containing protein [Candidatus Roizmanbacteria bacterium]|nr:PAS domain-containing protein [Candidatus Roizmanbacteria bacterium]